jgi:hypothetical protein
VRARSALVGAVAAVAAAVLALPAAAAAESMSAHVTTDHPVVDQELDIAGQVTGAASYPVTVTTTRDDSTGTATPVGTPVMTDDQGNFSVRDTPPARGHVTYHLSADGGAATADVTTTVAGKRADLTLRASPSMADADSSVHVVAHLDSPTTNRNVTIYARPYQGSKQQIDSGPVDAKGDRSTNRRIERRTTFIAVFAGDDTYTPARATAVVQARAVIDEHLKGGYATSHGRRLYHENDNPVIRVNMLPERKYHCIRFRAQHRHRGHWVGSAVSDCHNGDGETDGAGRVIGTFYGPDHIVGVPYRLRAEWRGTKAVRGRHGEWQRLEFRR